MLQPREGPKKGTGQQGAGTTWAAVAWEAHVLRRYSAARNKCNDNSSKRQQTWHVYITVAWNKCRRGENYRVAAWRHVGK